MHTYIPYVWKAFFSLWADRNMSQLHRKNKLHFTTSLNSLHITNLSDQHNSVSRITWIKCHINAMFVHFRRLYKTFNFENAIFLNFRIWDVGNESFEFHAGEFSNPTFSKIDFKMSYKSKQFGQVRVQRCIKYWINYLFFILWNSILI